MLDYDAPLTRRSGVVARVRAALRLAAYGAMTLSLMPVQYLLLAVWPHGARRLPVLYHRATLRVLGLRLRIVGDPAATRPRLLLANHVSWLDIPLLSAIDALSFVAKREVAGWPLFGRLAKLQRTVFVDRDRRSAVAAQADEMARRFAAGETLVLFPEGTSGDGNHVLPFKSSLIGAAGLRRAASEFPTPTPTVQPVTIAYVGLHGLPMGRVARPWFAWYGLMAMESHLWNAVLAGPIDAVAVFHPPIPLAEVGDRKRVAAEAERAVAQGLAEALTGRGFFKGAAEASPPLR